MLADSGQVTGKPETMFFFRPSKALRRDLCRVNFAGTNLKPFPNLAFPHSRASRIALKIPSFDGELMASF